MPIEQINEFELRGFGPLSRTGPKTSYFHNKTIKPKQIFE